MIEQRSYKEKGQVMVLLVLGMVVLLGFTALAIDGGMIYSERRHAQNAADAAVLAGALQKLNGQSDATVIQTALTSAQTNNYSSGQMSVAVNGPMSDFTGTYFLVTVRITSTLPTAFAHFVYSGPLRTTVLAIARVRPSQPTMSGFAITALGDCTAGGGADVGVKGGGASGGVHAYNGGIFSNAPETSSSSPCAFDPPQSGHDNISSDTVIASVGTVRYNEADLPTNIKAGSLDPVPVQTGMNGGVPISDPLAELPEPTCPSAGAGIVGGKYQPGSYAGSSLGAGVYDPGIYCITGDLKLSGQNGITGDGVVFYFISGGTQFTGQAGMTITAPNDSNCLPTEGDTSASCTYKGIALFAARNNSSSFDVRGNGGNAIEGLIYGISATMVAKGGGSDPDETSVIGQVITNRVLNDGNGSLDVTYNDNKTYHQPPRLSMEQ